MKIKAKNKKSKVCENLFMNLFLSKGKFVKIRIVGLFD